MVAAILIGDYLRMVAESRGETEKVAFHDATKKQLEAERNLLLVSRKW